MYRPSDAATFNEFSGSINSERFSLDAIVLLVRNEVLTIGNLRWLLHLAQA